MRSANSDYFHLVFILHSQPSHNFFKKTYLWLILALITFASCKNCCDTAGGVMNYKRNQGRCYLLLLLWAQVLFYRPFQLLTHVFFFSVRCPNSTSGGCCEPLRAVEVVMKLCNLLVIWIKNSATVPFAELPVNASSTFFISTLLYPRGRCWSEFWWCFFDTFLGFFPGTKAISDLSISLVPQRLRLLLCWMCWLQWNLRDRGWISPVVNLFQV